MACIANRKINMTRSLKSRVTFIESKHQSNFSGLQWW